MSYFAIYIYSLLLCEEAVEQLKNHTTLVCYSKPKSSIRARKVPISVKEKIAQKGKVRKQWKVVRRGEEN